MRLDIHDLPIARTAPMIASALRRTGIAHLTAADTAALLGTPAPMAGSDFAAGWDDLGEDRFMADGGRYRLRRHAVFAMEQGSVRRLGHQPHFQDRRHNRLNGGVSRWFEPIVQGEAVLARILTRLSLLLGTPGTTGRYFAEAHQIRINATDTQAGQPTPEGRHRDGVDWVFMMLVRRENIIGGTTEISTPDGVPTEHVLLSEPGEALILDDRRLQHCVSAIMPGCMTAPAFRDMLVMTCSQIQGDPGGDRLFGQWSGMSAAG
jgi:hypothetical protein